MAIEFSSCVHLLCDRLRLEVRGTAGNVFNRMAILTFFSDFIHRKRMVTYFWQCKSVERGEAILFFFFHPEVKKSARIICLILLGGQKEVY